MILNDSRNGALVLIEVFDPEYLKKPYPYSAALKTASTSFSLFVLADCSSFVLVVLEAVLTLRSMPGISNSRGVLRT